jgi:hypothetical protein
MAVPTVAEIQRGDFGFIVTMSVPEGTMFVSLERRANGVTMPVEGAVNITNADGWERNIVVDDFGAPQNTGIQYRAVALWTDGTTSEVVRGGWVSTPEFLNFGADYLSHATRPDIRMAITVESLPELTRDIKQEVIYALDRPDPIVVSGRRQYPSGQLSLLTFTAAERRALLQMISLTDVVALAPWQTTYGFDRVMHFSVGRVNESRVSRRATEPARRWSLEVQQVEPPLPENPIVSPNLIDPPSSGGGPIGVADPNVPDPTGATLWSNYLTSRWRQLAFNNWGEVAGI